MLKGRRGSIHKQLNKPGIKKGTREKQLLPGERTANKSREKPSEGPPSKERGKRGIRCPREAKRVVLRGGGNRGECHILIQKS